MNNQILTTTLQDVGQSEKKINILITYQVQVSMKGSTELHVLHNVSSLALIWSDHSNLLWLHSSTKKSCGNLLHICSFSPVQETHCLSNSCLQQQRVKKNPILSFHFHENVSSQMIEDRGSTIEWLQLWTVCGWQS